MSELKRYKYNSDERGGHYEHKCGDWVEFDDADTEIQRLEARVKELEGLIVMAACSNCNGSGVYHLSNGEPAQCQWCYETDSIRNPQERTK